ncbi:MAG: DUF362 domain-containing protein [Candidatus Lokiarchaeota archaeon]|nr:DUF362 domain-containing protein [Candidatus Lokiarchaeota archaeon]
MLEKTPIAIQKILKDDVKTAVFTSLELINAKQLMRDNMTVLLKPNLLQPAPPERAITTHPMIVRAVIQWVRQFNPTKIYVCDSSGGFNFGESNTERAMKESGLKAVCEEEGDLVECLPFEKTERRIYKVENPLEVEEFPSSVLLHDVDLIINLPKIKTHGQTTMTCCIKNMFGTILRTNKARTHAKYPSLNRFTSALTDIYSVSKPQLAVVDGYYCMEGNGPSAGKPVKLDIVLAGYDGVAIDSTVCKIIGVNSGNVKYLAFAEKKGLGTTNQDEIEIRGESIDNIKRKFKIPATIKPVSAWLPRAFADYLARRVFKATITFDNDKCRLCSTCWSNCPVNAISPPKEIKKGNVPIWDMKKCITCYCCAELCPYSAVDARIHLVRNVIFSWFGLMLFGALIVIAAAIVIPILLT